MQHILRKKMWKELKSNWLRYLALALMIIASMYIIVSLIGAADTIIIGTEEHGQKNKTEDGQFTVFVPLKGSVLKDLEDRGLTVEEMFYLDYELDGGDVLRLFKLRENIDLVEAEEGELPEKDNQIALEKRYCEENEIARGDTVSIAGHTFTVTAIVTSPDYDGVFREMGDSTADSAKFGPAFVTEDAYQELKDSGKSLASEEYLYAYLLNGRMTDSELRDRLEDEKFDPSDVEDRYFREYWARLYEDRDDLLDGVDELNDGAHDLADGIDELTETVNGDEFAMLRSFIPEDALDSLDELNDGGKDLASGTEELKDSVDDLVDEFMPYDLSNLRSFVKSSENPRIAGGANDVVINRLASILAGVIILIMLTYVLSVFVIHGIEEEQSVIGTLYALGVTRKDLMMHYLTMPVVVTFLAGALGTAIGYSDLGVPLQTADTYAYYSVPYIPTVIEPYVLIYGILMPPVIAAFVNYFVIRKKLSAPALRMIRNEQKHKEAADIDLGNMGFISRFRLRQMLREGRSAVAVVLGIFVCLLLVMIGLNAHVMCSHVGEYNIRDTKFEYMYLYKYPEETVPDGGYAAYAKTMKREAYGYNMDVTVLGLEPDEPFFDCDPDDSKTDVIISSAMAQKFKLDVGDEFVLNDEEASRLYAFRVKEITEYSPSFFVFMDIDTMRDMFGMPDDYFNAVFSDSDLGIDPGRLYSVTTKKDIEDAAFIFVELMKGMVYTMVIAFSVILALVMYLMMKVMIDRSSHTIALFKLFGYRKREISKLFLNGNTYLVLLGTAVSIPLAKYIMDRIYPYLVANVACGIDASFTPGMYGVIFLVCVAIYALIHFFLVGRLGKIEPNEVLKNRE